MDKGDWNKRSRSAASAVTSATRRHSKNTRSRARKRAQSRKHLMLFAAALVLLVIVLLVSGNKDELKGQWRIDEITAYRFDGEGNGALVLPDQEFVFRYTVHEDQLTIDFVSESARDFVYSYQIQGKKLTLTGGEGNDVVEYILSLDKGK